MKIEVKAATVARQEFSDIIRDSMENGTIYVVTINDILAVQICPVQGEVKDQIRQSV